MGVQELGGNQEKDAVKLTEIVFNEENAKWLNPYGLLYQFNEYQDTPITYCRQRTFMKLTQKLESVKYIHFHQLLIETCRFPYEIAHCVIGYVFVMVTEQSLATEIVRNKWDVL